MEMIKKEKYLLFIFSFFLSVLSLPSLDLMFAAGPVWDSSQHSNHGLGSLENLCLASQKLLKANEKIPIFQTMRNDKFCYYFIFFCCLS